jgi:hypothetical protein
MPSPGFEPAIPATKLPQTYVLGRAATEIGPLGPWELFFQENESSEV